MYLVKCECGCWYTLKEQRLEDLGACAKRQCPDCGIEHRFNEESSIKALSRIGFDVKRIPDNVRIEIKFNLE